MDDYAHLPRDRYRLNVQDINQAKRPNLAKLIKKEKFIYALGKLPDRLHDDGKVIYAAALNQSYLVTDSVQLIRSDFTTGAKYDRLEKMSLPYDSMELLSHIMLQDEINRLKTDLEKEKAANRGGRPIKYHLDTVKQVMQLRKEGVSIRKIGKRLHMSPTTVQKLMQKGADLDSVTNIMDDVEPAVTEGGTPEKL